MEPLITTNDGQIIPLDILEHIASFCDLKTLYALRKIHPILFNHLKDNFTHKIISTIWQKLCEIFGGRRDILDDLLETKQAVLSGSFITHTLLNENSYYSLDFYCTNKGYDHDNFYPTSYFDNCFKSRRVPEYMRPLLYLPNHIECLPFSVNGHLFEINLIAVSTQLYIRDWITETFDFDVNDNKFWLQDGKLVLSCNNLPAIFDKVITIKNVQDLYSLCIRYKIYRARGFKLSSLEEISKLFYEKKWPEHIWYSITPAVISMTSDPRALKISCRARNYNTKQEIDFKLTKTLNYIDISEIEKYDLDYFNFYPSDETNNPLYIGFDKINNLFILGVDTDN